MSGDVECQNCGKLNQYARWVGGEFKSYDRLVCSECGFLIYDEKKNYLVRKRELEEKNN